MGIGVNGAMIVFGGKRWRGLWGGHVVSVVEALVVI